MCLRRNTLARFAPPPPPLRRGRLCVMERHADAPIAGRPAPRASAPEYQASRVAPRGQMLKAMADQMYATFPPHLTALRRDDVRFRSVRARPPPTSTRPAAPPLGSRVAIGPRSSSLYDQAYVNRHHTRG